MKKNVSILQALLRITIGFTMLSLLTAKISKHKYSSFMALFFLLVGGYTVATGILRYCPISTAVEDMDYKKELDHYMNKITDY